MIKKSIILLILTLFISGCVERGKSVHPNIRTHQNIQQESTSNVQPAYVLRITAKDRKIDKVKNTISGTLMLVIGLMIIL